MAVKIQYVFQKYVKEECLSQPIMMKEDVRWMVEVMPMVIFVNNSARQGYTSWKSQKEIKYKYKSKEMVRDGTWHQVEKVAGEGMINIMKGRIQV